MTMVASHLNSDHERQRILSCKLIPCLRRSVNKVNLRLKSLKCQVIFVILVI